MRHLTRSVIVFVALAAVAGSTGFARPLGAQTDSMAPLPAPALMMGAMKTAQAEHKVIWVLFSASWCDPCKKLENLILTSDVKSILAAHYVSLKLIVSESADRRALENPNANILMTKFDSRSIVPPFSAFMDGGGRMIANSRGMPNGGEIGYPSTPERIQAFMALLQKTAPRMTADERAKVSEYLTKAAR